MLGLGVTGALVFAGNASPATGPSRASSAPAAGASSARTGDGTVPRGSTHDQVMQRVNRLHHAPATHVRRPAAPSGAGVAATTAYSGNWSGYVDVSHPYSSVISTWVVPKTTCSMESFAAFWVGIDGWSNGSVEQDGTGAYCAGPNATPYYFIWWEMYPQNDVQDAGLAVKPGDRIVAGVKYLGSNRYWLQVANTTTGKRISTYQYKAGAYSTRSSAEWIVEAPSGDAGQYPLAQFSPVTFTGANATYSTTHTAGYWPHYAVVMMPNGRTTAAPGSLSSAGSFTDVWYRAY